MSYPLFVRLSVCRIGDEYVDEAVNMQHCYRISPLTPGERAAGARLAFVGQPVTLTVLQSVDEVHSRVGDMVRALHYQPEIVTTELRDSAELPHPVGNWTASTGVIYRHLKRGSTYEAVGVADVQCSGLPLREGDKVVVYREVADGDLYVRRDSEFHDGRFQKQENT